MNKDSTSIKLDKVANDRRMRERESMKEAALIKKMDASYPHRAKLYMQLMGLHPPLRLVKHVSRTQPCGACNVNPDRST